MVDPLTKRAAKTLILEVVRTYNGQLVNRYNFIGHAPQEGDLYRKLERESTDAEKHLVNQAFDELIASGLLLPTYTQVIANDGRWVRITEKGNYALDNGTFDELDKALHALDPLLLNKRDGAQENLLSTSPHSLQDAANAARELLNGTLRALAPEEEVCKKDWFVADLNCAKKRGVNLSHKIRFALERNTSITPEDEELIDTTIKWAQAVSKKIVKATHSAEQPNREITKDLVNQVEAILRTILFKSV